MASLPPGGGAAKAFMAPGALVPVPGPDPGEAALWRASRDGFDLYYAPGCLCVVPSPQATAFEAGLALTGAPEGRWAGELWRRAARARATSARPEPPFRPECLTLYLHDECNQGCTYCYAHPRDRRSVRLDPGAVVAAADLVAANCQALGRSMTAVFHGGGEPSLYPEEVDELLDLVAGAAGRHAVGLFRYVATNGSLSAEGARWLARRFDLVGLSCDGPADIHDAQRPGRDGCGTLQAVERTARTLRAEGVRYHVRATITPAGLGRQDEIAAYICQHLAPEELRFEPVYGGGRSVLGAGDAPAFVAGLMAARQVAAGYGVPLTTSGCRLGAIHGPYCHVFRQVLNLLPDGLAGPAVATACFMDSTAGQARRRGTAIDVQDGETGQFAVDGGRVEALRACLAPLPKGCAACFNRFHCARGCPDACPLDGRGPEEAVFRCQASRSLAAALLAEAAEALWSEVLAGEATVPHGCLLP